MYLIDKAKKVKKVKNCKIKKKFKPNVFGCLPSSGLRMTVRTHATILPLWNVCAEERTRQVKECDGYSRRCFAGSEVSAGFECSAVRTARFLTVSLRSSATCDLRSAIVCDHMETSLKVNAVSILLFLYCHLRERLLFFWLEKHTNKNYCMG